MRRKRRSVPILPILFVFLVVMIGIIIYNSGLLVTIGLLEGNIPDDLDIDPNDPRVIAKVDETIDRNAVKDTVHKFVNLITGRVDQGVAKVIAVDGVKGFKLAGFKYELRDAITGEVLDVLETDASGEATSIPVDYKQAYRLVQMNAAHPYDPNATEIVFEMKADIMELSSVQKINDRVKAYDSDGSGQVVITELLMEVPLILQKPELPNGCEITALTALLNYNGYPIDKVTLSDQFLDKAPFYKKDNKVYGADPNIAFSGDPKDPGGWFVYAPPTVKAGQAYIDSVSGKHQVVDLTGLTEDEIMKKVSEGYPVGIWATRDLSLANFGYGWYLEADDTYFAAATNLHCMVIYGFKGDQLYVMDPLEGNQLYDRETFFRSFESLGSRAMIVEEPIDGK